MWFNQFSLKEKKSLTKDVFELVFTPETDFEIIPGQFITFILPQTKFWRSYSVLDKKWKQIHFLIKRLDDGRWWSKEICDYDVWTILKWIWPAWKFFDNKKDTKKLYIATWTWIVPLYFMVKTLLESWFKNKLKLVLWNRTFLDTYYLNELQDFKNLYSNFNYEIFLSREKKDWFKFWYVKEYVKNNFSNYDEFYICWNPNMIDEVVLDLENNWILKENIFEEKY